MKKLKNPFTKLEGYNCFVCSPDNPIGLQLDFYLDDDRVVTIWDPNPNFQGYPNILHGGIQATLLDEVASWAVYVLVGTGGVTSQLDIHYQKPVRMDRGRIEATARIREVRRKIAVIDVELSDGQGQICTTGAVYYYIYPPRVAMKKMHYPGKEAFL